MAARRRFSFAAALFVLFLTGDAFAPPAKAALRMDQAYRIMSVNSGLALDVWGVSQSPGAAVQQWGYWSSPNQEWTFQKNADGSYRIVSVNSGLCLDVVGISTAGGARLQQWTCWDSPNQYWNLVPADNGSFEIESVNSGMALDVIGVSTAPGALVQQWPYWGSPNQKWLIQPVDGQGNPTGGAAPDGSVQANQGATRRLGSGADPSITYFKGMYYLVQGDWGQHVIVFRSSNLNGLMSSEAFTYTNNVDAGFHAEAPDIAVVTDPRDGQQKLAIYITNALPYPGSIKVILTEDPAQGFEDMGFLANVSGYDAHYMVHPNGQQYLFYSNFASILIIPMSNPWTTSGGGVQISQAYLPWETQFQSGLNEAPAHVVSGNMLNLVYSANAWNDPAYLCGLITIDIGADPLNPANWIKHTDGPIFTSSNGHFGPGSGTFFNDGTATWFGYGSFPDPSNVNREIRAQTVNFAGDGTVQLGAPIGN